MHFEFPEILPWQQIYCRSASPGGGPPPSSLPGNDQHAKACRHPGRATSVSRPACGSCPLRLLSSLTASAGPCSVQTSTTMWDRALDLGRPLATGRTLLDTLLGPWTRLYPGFPHQAVSAKVTPAPVLSRFSRKHHVANHRRCTVPSPQPDHTQ